MNSEEIKKLEQVVRIGRPELVISQIADEIRSRLTPKESEPLKDMEKNILRGLSDDPTMDLEKFINNIVTLAQKGAFRH